jgi:acetyltransferase-like isoleucine patch superfamily enzyme
LNRQERKYDLQALYGRETSIQRYIRLTVGENAGIGALIWQELLLSLCGGLYGALGLVVRNRLYSYFFKGFDRKAFIGRHATLRCPRQIRLASGVIMDDFVQLIATSKVPEAITLGEESFVRSFAMINAGPPEGFVHIGHHSGIGQGALLYGNGGLTIGNHVLIAGQSALVASSHLYDRPDVPIVDQGYSAKGIRIEDNVWIGAGAKILDGITIGKGAIVGSNAVVTESVRPGDRVGGIPAYSLTGSRKSL